MDAVSTGIGTVTVILALIAATLLGGLSSRDGFARDCQAMGMTRIGDDVYTCAKQAKQHG